jgi:tRNA threonylcarbamoyladenosine biosynthesis protein TsaE
MSETTLTVATSAQMRTLGRSLARLLRPGDLLILTGGLGAGKTTLTQGIGDGLGVRGPITSPTFVIARVHPPLQQAGSERGEGSGASLDQRPSLVHADAYRLADELELEDLDLDADTAASVTVVEWGEGLAEGLADDRLEISIAAEPVRNAGADGDPGDLPLEAPRTVRIYAIGERWNGIELPLPVPGDRL